MCSKERELRSVRTSAASAWTLRYGVWLLNLYQRHEGGATSFERSHWKSIQISDSSVFDSRVFGAIGRKNLEEFLWLAKGAPRTFRSMWVGRAEESDEHLVLNEIGHVIRVRAVRRCVENENSGPHVLKLIAHSSIPQTRRRRRGSPGERWTPTEGCKACESAHLVRRKARRYDRLKYGRTSTCNGTSSLPS